MAVYRFPVSTLLRASFPTNGISANGLRADLERALDDTVPARSATPYAAADAVEHETGIVIDIDLPGVSPEAVEVLAEDGVLTVRGERATRELAPGARSVFAERAAGSFVRRFRLPKSADLGAVSASYSNGVLTVRIAKIAPAQPRRVTVEVAPSVPTVTPENA